MILIIRPNKNVKGDNKQRIIFRIKLKKSPQKAQQVNKWITKREPKLNKRLTTTAIKHTKNAINQPKRGVLYCLLPLFSCPEQL